MVEYPEQDPMRSNHQIVFKFAPVLSGDSQKRRATARKNRLEGKACDRTTI